MKVAKNIRKEIKKEISNISKMTTQEIVNNRYEKFRNISGFNII